MAAQEGHIKIVKLLVDNGADLFAVTRTSATALHLAVANKRAEVVAFLGDKMQSAKGAPSHSEKPPQKKPAPKEEKKTTTCIPFSQKTTKLEDIIRCPITGNIMSDPVVAADGHTYERKAITEWIREHGISPKTKQLLSLELLFPNLAIKSQIETYKMNENE